MTEKDSLTAAMKTSISEILEKMFFLPLEFSEEAEREDRRPAEGNGLTVSRLHFSGPFSGYFLCAVPKVLARSITADFMGKDAKDLSETDVAETVKEVSNMIAGNTFTLYDDGAVFDLDIPEVLPSGTALGSSSDPGERISLTVKTLDDHSLTVQMVIYS